MGIVVAAVELARNGSPEEMVASLGWLALDLDQAGDLLVQANCVVRKLLLSGDTDMARTAAAMVPGCFFLLISPSNPLFLKVLCWSRQPKNGEDQMGENCQEEQ